jgi:hypothetical protein
MRDSHRPGLLTLATTGRGGRDSGGGEFYGAKLFEG